MPNLESLAQLEPILEDYDMELKLILLVRDPRSIYHSRKKMAMSVQKKESSPNTWLMSSNCFLECGNR